VAKSVFDAPQFKTEDGAIAYVEARLWPTGPVCPHCGNTEGARIRKMAGKTTRAGLYKCNECRKPFTVRMGTLFESSHLGLHLWLQVIHLVCASKRGISTNQIQRMLSCSMKTAWFLSHRIREAMKEVSLGPLGGAGKVVEIDETFYGSKYEKPEGARGYAHKNAVLTRVERGGKARSFHMDGTKAADQLPIIKANVDPATHVMTVKLGVDDAQRADAVLQGVVGKRLTYRTVGKPAGNRRATIGQTATKHEARFGDHL
jgi:transposase-like protein